jgi:hypothetical protein
VTRATCSIPNSRSPSPPDRSTAEKSTEPTQGRDNPDDAFKRAFAAVLPLVKEEWPSLDPAALEATHGDFDKVTALVAEHTDHTRLVIRRQLGELLAVAERSASRAANGAATERPKGVADQMDDVLAAVRRLESFASEEAKRMSSKVIPLAETRVRQNLWVSLLLAHGLVVILGLWMNGGRRR